MQNKLYEMLLDENEITWQSVIYDLVKEAKLNPWDIDISLLSKKYLEKIKELQELNFFISGKMVLAASILLRLKSIKFLEENLADFDNLLFPKEDELLLDDLDNQEGFQKPIPGLLIKTPQARKRKINLNDLMEALQQALEVENRRLIRRREERVLREVPIPTRKIDISSFIKNIYAKIKEFFQKHQLVTFSQLLPSESKEDKVITFLSLLHLESKGKINLFQETPFGEIEISDQKENNIKE